MIKMQIARGEENDRRLRKVYHYSRKLRDLLRFRITVRDGRDSYEFVPAAKGELLRYLGFFSKEEGTIAWIKNTVHENDVFFDIGANVGLYSLYAARRAKNVRVYAFEPHKYNFVCLMDNISSNRLEQAITPIAVPLGDKNDVFTLNYASKDSGSSQSQLGHKKMPGDRAFAPAFEEIVYAVTLDELVAKKAVPMPTVVKIDVDGNEMPILHGMKEVLSAPNKPRSVQVEANPGQKQEILAFMQPYGYKHDHSHYTALKKERFAQGASEDELAHNMVFVC
jgi:FkbM family methyltransferase